MSLFGTYFVYIIYNNIILKTERFNFIKYKKMIIIFTAQLIYYVQDIVNYLIFYFWVKV